MFDWEDFEQAEYNRSSIPTFVDLTERRYLTASGLAPAHTSDPAFLALASMVARLAAVISEGPNQGIDIPEFKPYRPYPLQAVWTNTHFKIWLKQPLFITQDAFEQARAKTDLNSFIQLESLEEGLEIQQAIAATVQDHSGEVAQLREFARAQGYTLLNDTTYRELYLDGIPLDHTKQILLRVPLSKDGQQPFLAARN